MTDLDFDDEYVSEADDPFLVEDTGAGWDDLDHDPAALQHALGAVDTPPEEPDDGADRARKSVATQLVELAEARYRFAVSDAGDPIALRHDGPNIAHPLRGGRLGLRAALAESYFNSHGKAASSSSLTDALAVIEGRAQHADVIEVHHRVGSDSGRVVVDLGTPDGRAVVIDSHGWRIVERSPVTFARSDLTAALPDPVPSDLDLLTVPLGNVAGEDWPMLVAWMVASYFPAIAHPVPFMRGEQGTGKTTTCRRLVELIDPSAAPIRSAPRDLEQWIIAAAGSWVIAIDNLTTIPGWFSDALCRAVTGEGMVRRRLYTDGALAVTRFRRVVLMTAIDGGSLRGDLTDRVLPIGLERIGPGERRTDVELADEWDELRPRFLGALFQLVADVLGVIDDVELDELPRMADFARITAAVDRVRPIGRFGRSNALDRYLEVTEGLQADVVDDDPFATAVASLAADSGGWSGTASELLERLAVPEPIPRSWPRSARAVSGRLRTITPALSTIGVEVDYSKDTSRTRARLIHLATSDTRRNRPSEPSEPSAKGADLGEHTGRSRPNPDGQPSAPSDDRPHKHAGHTPSDGSDGRNPHKYDDTTDSEHLDLDRYEDDYPEMFR